MIKKLIVFDFDGVLADSFNTLYPLLRATMRSVGISLTPDQYRDFFMGNIHQSFKDFINNDKKFEIAKEFRNSNYDKYYYSHPKVKLFPGVINFLKEINRDYILTVASSGREDNIKNLLSENTVASLFSLILANTATSKEGMIKKILNKYQVNPGRTFFVTDTVGDIKAAKKVGLKTIAVSWGFHDKKRLLAAKPDHITSNFKTLESTLKNF